MEIHLCKHPSYQSHFNIFVKASLGWYAWRVFCFFVCPKLFAWAGIGCKYPRQKSKYNRTIWLLLLSHFGMFFYYTRAFIAHQTFMFNGKDIQNWVHPEFWMDREEPEYFLICLIYTLCTISKPQVSKIVSSRQFVWSKNVRDWNVKLNIRAHVPVKGIQSICKRRKTNA